jgi:hypothetical protein
MKEIKINPTANKEEKKNGKSFLDCAIWKKTIEVVKSNNENVQMAKKLCSME